MPVETPAPPTNVTTADQFSARRTRAEHGQRPPHEAFVDIEDKTRRLETINRYLAEHHLKPLTTVGDHSDPKMGVEFGKILEDKQVRDPNRIYYHVVKFDTTFKGGTKGEYSLIFKPNGEVVDGTVVIARIKSSDGQNRYVLVNQFRPALGKRTNEFPRGFAELTDKNPTSQSFNQSVNIADLPGLGGLRELTEETGIDKVKSVVSAGQLAEDSSIMHSNVNVVVVEADSRLTAQNLDTSEATAQVLFETPEQLWGGIKSGEVPDMHSVAALVKAATHDRQTAIDMTEGLMKIHAVAPQQLPIAA